MEKKKYLFVGGCGRSGTSVLTEIIGKHPQIVLALERYNKVMRKNSLKLGVQHFSKERFADVREGDTFYSDINRFPYHHGLMDKWEHAVFVGTKYPRIDEVYCQLEKALGPFPLIYIVRDVIDVAASWDQRAIKTQCWGSNRDHKKAVIRWNESMKNILTLIHRGKPIFVVRYENLLFGNAPLNPLFEALGLDMHPLVEEELSKARKKAPAVRSDKIPLSSSGRGYVSAHAELSLLDALNKTPNVLV